MEVLCQAMKIMREVANNNLKRKSNIKYYYLGEQHQVTQIFRDAITSQRTGLMRLLWQIKMTRRKLENRD